MTVSQIFIGPFTIEEIIVKAEKKNKDRLVYKKGNKFYLANYDAREYGDKEYSELMSNIKNGGYQSFLQLTMIEDCVLNLKEQIRKPSLEQKIKSVIFYFENDAFIVL